MTSAFLSGFITGGGLIIAVGAQNAFLLEQALKRHYALWVALLFIISDAISISLGAFGIGALIKQHPIILEATRYAGVAFLLYFSYTRIKASFADEALLLSLANERLTFLLLISSGLAVTWLNPHFYLDTMIVMGTLANQWGSSIMGFIWGGITASIVWFLGLVIIGRVLAPYLSKAAFWRWLNRINGTLVAVIAMHILFMPL